MERYELSEQMKERCLSSASGGDFFDWHKWADLLSEEERALLESEVISASSLDELTLFAKQYYRFVANNREDLRLREVERKFVEAQIDNQPQETIREIEQEHFLLTKEILLQEKKERG